MPPTFANGKICYVEIPAVDIRRSADFYERVFGWRIRQRGDGATAFDDTVGEVSGAFVVGRPVGSPGPLVYVWCDSVAATIELIRDAGGEIVQPIGVDAPEITARFRDPAGNVFGLYQEPPASTTHAESSVGASVPPEGVASEIPGADLLRTLSSIHHYWFGELGRPDDVPAGRSDIWFRQSDETDRHIRDTYGEALRRAGSAHWNPYSLSPDKQIGLIVLLDQFPRNLFRQSGEAFAYDELARSIAKRLIAKGDAHFHPLERVFLYLPLEHGESLADQDWSVELFQKLVAELGEGGHPFYKAALDFAEKHRVLIRRFGRFPHRNEMLGRESTAEEAAFLKENGRGY